MRKGSPVFSSRGVAMETIKELQYPGGQRFAIVLHDLLHERVDCIVNAANAVE